MNGLLPNYDIIIEMIFYQLIWRAGEHETLKAPCLSVSSLMATSLNGVSQL